MARAQATPSSGIATTLSMEQLRRYHRFNCNVVKRLLSKLDALLEDPAMPEVELYIPIDLLVDKEIHLRALDAAIRSGLTAADLDDDFATPKEFTERMRIRQKRVALAAQSCRRAVHADATLLTGLAELRHEAPSGLSTPNVTDFTHGTALSGERANTARLDKAAEVNVTSGLCVDGPGGFAAREGSVLANAVPEHASSVITEPRLGASIDPPSTDSVVFAHDPSAALSSDRVSTTQDDDAADPDLSSLVLTDGPAFTATRERSLLVQPLNEHREQAASSLATQGAYRRHEWRRRQRFPPW